MITEAEEEALRAAGAVLKRLGISHVVFDHEHDCATASSFDHGWRRASGKDLPEACWKHLEQAMKTRGELPMDAKLQPPWSLKVLSDVPEHPEEP